MCRAVIIVQISYQHAGPTLGTLKLLRIKRTEDLANIP